METWLANGWLHPHQTSDAEIRDLWLIAGRDLKDAESGAISPDWQFGIAFNAALKLCTILLYAEGYRPEKQLAHYRTLQALPVIRNLFDAIRAMVADPPGPERLIGFNRGQPD